MKLSDYEMHISFNLRVSYHEALKCIQFIESKGGYGNCYPGGSSYYGSVEDIGDLITFMDEKDIDLDSMAINKNASVATKEKLKQWRKKNENI